MRIVIVGGGISAVYLANAIMEKAPHSEVVIVSDEITPPYDRIHLCALVDKSQCVESITLDLHPKVRLELNQKILHIDTEAKRILSEHALFSYDKLVIATGSYPKELFDIEGITNASTFRSESDCEKIAEGIVGKNVVIVGVGPIGLEFLDTLMRNPSAKSITLLARKEYLYGAELSHEGVTLLRGIFEQDPRIRIWFNDEIIAKTIHEERITQIVTKHGTIEDPFLVFGVGIDPNIGFARESLECDKGILVNASMRTSDPDIYCVGEAAQLREGHFIAGRVKECTLQADVAVSNLLGLEDKKFVQEVSIDGLKVGSFLFADLRSPTYNPKDPENETIQITHENRIDQYIVSHDRLKRFIGINTNIDLLHLKSLIEKDEPIDAAYLYSNRLVSEKGRLICSCESVHEEELIDIIKLNAVTSFGELKPFTKAGRVCGRCRQDINALIAATPVDPEEAARLREEREAKIKEAELSTVRARIGKYNTLHPKNQLSAENLEEALESFEMSREFNRWVSMITATMNLHPGFEEVVKEGVTNLNKIPIIWLELSDCTGNSEGFIKSSHPKIDDLILKYISLDYHELLMAGSGNQSESALDAIIRNDAGKYVLIVEGAVPLGLDGKFLRIGPKGETGAALLQRVAKDAAAVVAVGSCAYDGGVVAAAPNPTGAVGVSEALGRTDIINLPGCPVNPINIVGTLLHFIMFDEFPKLDGKNRPEWAYSFLVHDNCERRGHYDLEEFVQEWGDEGAKKGWCLFQMGCKGPYAELNCSMVKFNEGTSWPVQAGHGCFGCGQGKIAFDEYANERPLKDETHE
ncbi:MAG: hydrogenase small subunit [Sulfuricurvum sp.]|jgi:quinone-reactive Ni/Fe-hydrogenase small subunit|uniref:hydrogenase small subunit n=1 Tax=Sulfuricurvum sp. TaxID=2025608 RepID=UPI0025FA6C4E|nr:hydrogenase small subunit [Sulfuricurvum sp.]MCK9374269.1 hydrogenase small subunit [Sulfuricurvum sp.]